jgi:hypothetical protein
MDDNYLKALLSIMVAQSMRFIVGLLTLFYAEPALAGLPEIL